jgi:hypothetical protein
MSKHATGGYRPGGGREQYHHLAEGTAAPLSSRFARLRVRPAHRDEKPLKVFQHMLGI